MLPVENRNDSDCGIAAICNVSATNYATVRRHLRRKTIRGGMSDYEIEDVARAIGLRPRRIAHRRPSLGDFCKRHKRGKYIVIIHVGATHYHAVAVVEGLAMNAQKSLMAKICAVWVVE